MTLEIHWTFKGGDIYDAFGRWIASTEEGESVARLIAVAPELLEACKLLIDSYSPYTGLYAPGRLNEAREAARAAIAKAEGRS